MKVTKFTKTASFAPAEWVGIVNEDTPIRIRYRTSVLEVYVGEIPLRTHKSSEMLLNKQIETDGNQSRLDTQKMIELVNENIDELSISINERRQLRDNDIRILLDDIGEYLDDKRVE